LLGFKERIGIKHVASRFTCLVLAINPILLIYLMWGHCVLLLTTLCDISVPHFGDGNFIIAGLVKWTIPVTFHILPPVAYLESPVRGENPGIG
jgi:hypothetical protein